jgi:hypothetical protein
MRWAPGETEAALHAMGDTYNDETECALLVEADNAFSRLNRAAALRNLKIICPVTSKYLANVYQQPTRLYIGKPQVR